MVLQAKPSLRVCLEKLPKRPEFAPGAPNCHIVTQFARDVPTEKQNPERP